MQYIVFKNISMKKTDDLLYYPPIFRPLETKIQSLFSGNLMKISIKITKEV